MNKNLLLYLFSSAFLVVPIELAASNDDTPHKGDGSLCEKSAFTSEPILGGLSPGEQATLVRQALIPLFQKLFTQKEISVSAAAEEIEGLKKVHSDFVLNSRAVEKLYDAFGSWQETIFEFEKKVRASLAELFGVEIENIKNSSIARFFYSYFSQMIFENGAQYLQGLDNDSEEVKFYADLFIKAVIAEKTTGVIRPFNEINRIRFAINPIRLSHAVDSFICWMEKSAAIDPKLMVQLSESFLTYIRYYLEVEALDRYFTPFVKILSLRLFNKIIPLASVDFTEDFMSFVLEKLNTRLFEMSALFKNGLDDFLVWIHEQFEKAENDNAKRFFFGLMMQVSEVMRHPLSKMRRTLLESKPEIHTFEAVQLKPFYGEAINMIESDALILNILGFQYLSRFGSFFMPLSGDLLQTIKKRYAEVAKQLLQENSGRIAEYPLPYHIFGQEDFSSAIDYNHWYNAIMISGHLQPVSEQKEWIDNVRKNK